MRCRYERHSKSKRGALQEAWATMNSPIELKMLGTGSNWMNVGGIIAVALNSYYSPLPPGSVVSVSTMDPGYGAMESPTW